MQSNRAVPRNLPGRYSTDVVAEKTIDFMKTGKDSGKLFFLTVAPIGPHGQTLFPFTAQSPSNFPIFGPPVPADRHKNLFSNVGIPRQVSFNKLVTGSAPSYLKDLPEWNQTVIDYYDEYYHLRLAPLAAVDDLVTSVMDPAKNIRLLNNTYFIYTSDNGYHIGQHRLPAGKSCGYEEDINVPFIIRGPGIAKNSVYNAPTSDTDIAPTLFSLAGISLRNDFDGQTMPLFNDIKSSKHHHPTFPDTMKQEHINVEFWVAQLPEGRFGRDLVGAAVGSNNTYKAVRLISDAYNYYYYAVWCTGDRELYNMKIDKHQTSNLAVGDFVMEKSTHSKESTTLNDDYGSVQARLDTLLLVLKTCKGETCRNPWKVFHPSGKVQSMSDAMESRCDKCYDKQPRVTFSKCARLSAEVRGVGFKHYQTILST